MYIRILSVTFEVIVEPLRSLKKIDVPFTWGKNQLDPFEKVKHSLPNLHTLKQRYFRKPFELHYDAASTSGIGLVLCQSKDNSPYPVVLVSRALSMHEQRYLLEESKH